jgi:subtilisin-like proprotein convertase family protein
MKKLFFSNPNLGKVVYCLTVFAVAATSLWFVAGSNPASAVSNSANNITAATFPGTGVGAIPDGLAGTPPQYGAPLVVSFAVAGVSAAVTDVSVSMTLTHTWVGDVDVILRAPGGTPSMVVVSRIGVTTATSFGSANDYSGTYVFTDTATGANIWTAAAANPVPAGSYRTTAPGQAGQTNPAPVTSLNTTFGGMTPAAANGAWTLSFRDAASADIGTVTAASLTVNPTGGDPFTPAPNDLNGDDKSDYVVVRNVGGGPTGQVRWFYNFNGTGAPTVALDWGIATDFFVMEDFDGDRRDDIAVWREEDPGGSKFYILQSFTNTARIDTFGQVGDDPTVVDDYDGDGKADVAVYRRGANFGDQSTWFYRTTPGGAVTYVPWGQFGDFVSPGDYDGDGKSDFVIRRNFGGGQAGFWTRLANGTVLPVIVFGTPGDTIVPGDYDGDGKCDIATIRNVGGAIQWQFRSSISNSINYFTFGSWATDTLAPGDYDGDGKAEPAIWRPNPDPTQNFFWSLNSSNGAAQVFELGQNGDYPVGNWNVH